MNLSDYLTLDDFYRRNHRRIIKENKAKSMFFNSNTGVLDITCPDDSKVILTREMFPNRDIIKCYKIVDGKTVFSHNEGEVVV